MVELEYKLPLAPLREHTRASHMSGNEKDAHINRYYDLFTRDQITLGDMARVRSIYDADYPQLAKPSPTATRIRRR